MRVGAETFLKTNFRPISGKVNDGDQNGIFIPISGKVESDDIKKIEPIFCNFFQ